ncbi:lysophospholipid acyltransferase family protein [Candidatus Chlorohelix sp.]|uniref:lysophospholipid acyltransferase family protein n=1 Tax=Candidatus Chlorohelix sp. TaxID=3139201 RepID=UPI00304F31AB
MNTVRLFRFGARVMPYIPYRVIYAVCGFVAFLIYYLIGRIRENVLWNLSHVLPDYTPQEREKIARRIIKNNLCNYIDIMRQGKMTTEQFKQQVTVNGIENIYKAQERGKGVIMVSGHLGSFSFSMQRASSYNVDFNLVVEPIEPPEMYDFIKKQRQTDNGVKLIPMGGMEVREIFRVLKRNAVVCMAIDRDVNGEGHMMEFFGADAPIPLGVAEVALRTGAEIIFVHPYRTSNSKHIIDILPGFSPETNAPNKQEAVRELTARMLREVEKLIRRTPDNWMVLQPIWKKEKADS